MYIQNLHFDLSRARALGDFAMLVLATVSVMIVPASVFIGMCTLCGYSSTNQANE